MEINVKPTVEIINEMAKTLEDFAQELRQDAKKMQENNDISYASEAIQTIKNCFSNLRLDLLVARPLREFNSIIIENQNKKIDYDKMLKKSKKIWTY